MATATKSPTPTNSKKEEAVSKPVVRRTRSAPVEKHPLEHLIPDAWFAEDYYSRKIGGVVDIVAINTAMKLHHNVMISGPTGCAKTSLVYAVAAGATGRTKIQKDENGDRVEVNIIDPALRRPLVYIPCNGAIEPSQFLGRWVPTPDGRFRFVLGDLGLAVIYGGIGYFDEVNFAKSSINAAIHGLTDKRRVLVVLDASGSGICANCGLTNDVSEDYSSGQINCNKCGHLLQSTSFFAHPTFQVICAFNEGTEYEGTRKLNAAYKNRFAIHLPFDYDPEIEGKMVTSARLLKMAQQLRTSNRSGDLRTPVSTNMLIELEEFAANEDLGFGFAMENFLNKFEEDERPAVKSVMEVHASDIMTELLAGDDEYEAEYEEDDTDIDTTDTEY